MQLAEMTWRQVSDYLEHDDRIIVPVGSTEQHGPKAVLGTDYLVPTGIAARAGEEAGVLVAPPLVYGMSLHHMAFPGTISLRPSTFLRVIVDVLSALERHGFHRILLLNGHGGNRGPLAAGVAEFNDLHPQVGVKMRDWWDLPGIKELQEEAFGDKEGGHGTPSETSLVMALRPGVVSTATVEVHETTWPPVWPNYLRWAEHFPDGSAGADANLASAEWGNRLLETAVAGLKVDLEHW